MTSNLKKEVYSSRETAQILGVSLRTIQLWVESGILDAWKTAGGHRRIVKASVERFLNQQYAAIEESQRETSLSIVIIEDDQFQLELYRMKLKEWPLPLQVSIASDGIEGLLLIGQKTPDLVIADLSLPGIDGVRMVQSLLTTSTQVSPKVIVMSSLSDHAIESLGGIPEEVPFLRKPVDFTQLEALVAEAMTQKNNLKARRNFENIRKQGTQLAG